jgi:hypothetical protein
MTSSHICREGLDPDSIHPVLDLVDFGVLPDGEDSAVWAAAADSEDFSKPNRKNPTITFVK